LNQKIRPCKACGLYLNQLPALDNSKNPNIFWVGLSAVQFNDEDEKIPLTPNTRSGALIEKIEEPLRDDVTFYKTNLVKCLPLKDGKIRYPIENEMEKCFPNFEYELDILKPKFVFLLGKQVAAFVMNKLGIRNINLSELFEYETFEINGTLFIPIHHPSFILVYKRKFIPKYINSIQAVCEESMSVGI